MPKLANTASSSCFASSKLNFLIFWLNVDKFPSVKLLFASVGIAAGKPNFLAILDLRPLGKSTGALGGSGSDGLKGTPAKDKILSKILPITWSILALFNAKAILVAPLIPNSSCSCREPALIVPTTPFKIWSSNFSDAGVVKEPAVSLNLFFEV